MSGAARRADEARRSEVASDRSVSRGGRHVRSNPGPAPHHAVHGYSAGRCGFLRQDAGPAPHGSARCCTTGSRPIYHLYFGDEMGTPGNLTTTFPWRRTGRKARAGTGQIGIISYTVPKGSHDFWVERFNKHKVEISKQYQRFGQKVLQVKHPECGLTFELVEADDSRKPWVDPKYGVPENAAIRGFTAGRCRCATWTTCTSS